MILLSSFMLSGIKIGSMISLLLSFETPVAACSSSRIEYITEVLPVPLPPKIAKVLFTCALPAFKCSISTPFQGADLF